MLANACPKPAPRVKVPHKGPTAKRRAKKARAVVLAEKLAKSIVRDRDVKCRWPGCNCDQFTAWNYRLAHWSLLEVAHLEPKGAGGDPRGIRTQPHLMIYLCRWRHQGPFGLEARRSKVVPLTERGTNGRCAFWYQHEKDGPWLLAGVTEPPHPREGVS